MHELLALFQLTRVTGIPMSRLACSDAEEVQLMMDIQLGRTLAMLQKVKDASELGQAEVVTATLLQILVQQMTGL